MTQRKCRYDFVEDRVPSVAQIMDRVAQSTDSLVLKRQAQLKTSLRRLIKHGGLDPERIPFIPPVMQGVFQRVSISETGLSKKSIQNDRSNVRFLLGHFGLSNLGQYRVPLEGEHRELFAKLGDRHLKAGISRLLRFAQVHGVALAEIDDFVAAQFHNALVQEGVLKDPQTSWRSALHSWNKVRDLFPDLGLQALTPPRRSDHWGCPWNVFPQSLVNEIENYFTVRSEVGDLFDPDAPDVLLRPRTIETQRDWLRVLASAAVRSGVDIALITSLTKLVDPQTVEAALRWYMNDHKGNCTEYPVMLVAQAATVAKALRRPEADIDRLGKLVKKLRRFVKHAGSEPRRLDRLEQFESRQNELRIVALSDHVVATITRKNTLPSPQDRLAVQMAVVHELFLTTSLRRSNVVALDLDRHFIWPDGPDGKRCLIRIPGNEVKNHDSLHKELPEHVIDLIRLYRARYRSDSSSAWLFPGRNGQHKRPSTLTQQYGAFVKLWTGLEVTPHLMRSFADKLYTDRHPEGGEVMRRQLGHRSPETRIGHYADPRSRAAGRAYQKLFLEERKTALDDPTLFVSPTVALRTGKGRTANPDQDVIR